MLAGSDFRVLARTFKLSWLAGLLGFPLKFGAEH
jgi:hypothetical protein